MVYYFELQIVYHALGAQKNHFLEIVFFSILNIMFSLRNNEIKSKLPPGIFTGGLVSLYGLYFSKCLRKENEPSHISYSHKHLLTRIMLNIIIYYYPPNFYQINSRIPAIDMQLQAEGKPVWILIS